MVSEPSWLLDVAKVAVGGSLAQAVVTLLRRRSEVRQLDRETDSVAVETMESVIVRLHSELDHTKADFVQVNEECCRKDAQVRRLSDRVVKAETENSTLRAEVAMLRTASESRR